MEERERDRQFELRKIELNLKKTKIQQHGSRVGSAVGSVNGSDNEEDNGCIIHQYKGFKGPKMPAFDNAKDDLDSYIQRFERYAEVQKWNAKDRAVFLSALLREKALDVFSRLPVEDAMKYDTKDGFVKTVSTYRRRIQGQI